ncbi:MAG: thioredoxin reductase [Candidatus Diapherotrites archaeon]|nr:thioredoxin reductase [Candidatus Diapherotrites archaeon]MDN5366971.1 thioredoxin reductase [Candidatus Diapherotrites archaeon]
MPSPFSFSLESPVLSKAELKPEYDVVIVGGGPAGLATAIYAARAMLRTAVISKDFGGQVLDAHSVENYPGFIKTTGQELMNAFKEHAEHFGAELIQATVKDIWREGDHFVVDTDRGSTKAPAIIYATGSTHRKLGVPGEEEFLGKGVSYCAICDAALFQGKVVAVVGGGNMAFMDADLLTQHASKVYIIHRRNEFRAEPLWVERLKKNPKVEFITPYVVERIEGTDKVEKLIIKNRETGETKELPVDGVFIDIGMIPQTELAKRVGVELNERGYIIVREDQSTNVSGFFAAGDVTTGMNGVHQIVTAAAKGAIAALSAYDYLKGKGFVK